MKDKEKQIEICENCKKQNDCNHRELIHKDSCNVNDCDYYSEAITTDKEKQLVNDLVEIFDKEYNERMLITPTFTAKQLCELGYCKIDKDSVVLSMEEYERLNGNKLIDVIRKETAEKIIYILKDYYGNISVIDKIAKQFGVELKQ